MNANGSNKGFNTVELKILFYIFYVLSVYVIYTIMSLLANTYITYAALCLECFDIRVDKRLVIQIISILINCYSRVFFVNFFGFQNVFFVTINEFFNYSYTYPVGV